MSSRFGTTAFLLFVMCVIGTSATAAGKRAETQRTDTLASYSGKMEFEKNVVTQIRTDLAPLVKDDTYEVTAAAVVEKVKHVQSQKTVESRSGMTTVTGKSVELLPGFRDLKDSNADRNSSTAITYEQVDELKSLTITAFLADNIPVESETVINDYLQNKWAAANPNVVTVATKKIAFPKPDVLPPLLPKTLRDYWTTENILKTLLVLAGFLMLLTLVRMRPKSEFSVNAEMHGAAASQPLSNAQDQAPKPTVTEAMSLNTLRDSFVREMVEDPLFARGFFGSVNDTAKHGLLDLFQSSYLRGVLAAWMHTDPNVSAMTEGSPAMLQALLEEFRNYKRLRQKQIALPFGFLADLTDAELCELVANESAEALAPVLKHARPNQIPLLLTRLTVDEQLQLVQTVRSSNADANTTKIESRLKAKSQQIADRLASLTHEPGGDMIDAVLEQSPQSQIVAEKMIALDPTLKPRLAKYLLGLDHLFTQEITIIKRVIGAVENEVLITALSDMDDTSRKKIYDGMSRERARIIEGIRKSEARHFGTTEVQMAKSALVKQMRAMLRT